MSHAHALNITPIRPSWRRDFVADSPAMQLLLTQVERLAELDLPVLIEGETGVGKEVLAKALHVAGRPGGPYVAVNCAAIPETLIEAELFGHAKGAFTGAVGDKAGLFAAAHGGTLLLDEVGDLPLHLQAKLLRVLEDGTVRRVGATSDTRVTARIIAATNQDLTQLLAAGRFREDLYHRLTGVTLFIPPLRERPEDFAPLFERFLGEAPSLGRSVKVAPGTIEALQKRPWRGNVRELRQAVRRAIALGGSEISERDFLSAKYGPVNAEPISSWLAGKRWKEIEKSIFALVIEQTGTIRGAAEVLGIPKSTLADRVRALRIPVPDTGRPSRVRSRSVDESNSLIGME